MKWRREYEIGVASIDAQHRELFERVELLLGAVRDRSADKAAETFEFMREYTALHFKEEEAAMVAAAFPEVQAHAEEHANFARRLQSLEADHARMPSGPWLTLNLAVELGHWLRDHILAKDHAFGAFLRQVRGASGSRATSSAIGPAGFEPAPGSPQRAF